MYVWVSDARTRFDTQHTAAKARWRTTLNTKCVCVFTARIVAELHVLVWSKLLYWIGGEMPRLKVCSFSSWDLGDAQTGREKATCLTVLGVLFTVAAHPILDVPFKDDKIRHIRSNYFSTKSVQHQIDIRTMEKQSGENKSKEWSPILVRWVISDGPQYTDQEFIILSWIIHWIWRNWGLWGGIPELWCAAVESERLMVVGWLIHLRHSCVCFGAHNLCGFI